MITLTVKRDKKNTEKHEFSKKTVIIGGEDASADLSIDGEMMKGIHLKIVEENGHYTVYNVANDPFVTVNELPFGKHSLHNHDNLQIGDTTIALEILSPTTSLSSTIQDTEKELLPILERAFRKQKPQIAVKTEKIVAASSEVDEKNAEETFEEEMRRLDSEAAEEPWDDELSEKLGIQELLASVSKAEKPAEPAAEETPPQLSKPITIYDLDDEYDVTSSQNESEPRKKDSSSKEQEEKQHPQVQKQMMRSFSNKKNQKRRLWIFLSAASMLLFILVTAGVYTSLTSKSHLDEIKAARSIADIAMGLTYAQINGLKPTQQNWSDPQFLKNTVLAMLSKDHPSLASVDAHGKLEQSPYLVRIYTNRDISRFIVMAQPEPSLLQWIAPRKTIVIDSYTMELRKIADLRNLNRLLVQPHSLSGDVGVEVAEIIHGGEIIAIKELKDRNNLNGFEPPPALASVKPGSENLVYNAPRYSQVGEKLITSAIDLVSRPSSKDEVRKMVEELRVVAKLPKAVLYTSQGKEVAIKAEKALQTLVPEEQFLIGFINYDLGKEVISSQLLPLSRSSMPAIDFGQTRPHQSDQRNTSEPFSPLEIATRSVSFRNNVAAPMEKKADESSEIVTPFSVKIETESPLFNEMSALATNRFRALEHTGSDIIELVKENTQAHVADFPKKIDFLVKKYIQVSEQQGEKTRQILKELYLRFHVPLATFDAYVTAAGLEGVNSDTLKQMQGNTTNTKQAPPVSEKLLSRYLGKINNAQNLNELDEATMVTTTLVSLDKIPNTEKLTDYQNRIKTATIARLEALLLNGSSKLPEEQFSQENREVLIRILSTAWINDTEERTFYLSEFDQAGGSL